MTPLAIPERPVRLELESSECRQVRSFLEHWSADLEHVPEQERLMDLIVAISDAQYLAWWKRERVSLLLNRSDAELLKSIAGGHVSRL